MRTFIPTTLTALVLALLASPSSAQYSSSRGGNCEKPLVAWKGARMPCDGYAGQRGHQQGQRGGQQTRTTVTTTVVHTGTVAVKVGTAFVNRRTGEVVFVPAR